MHMHIYIMSQHAPPIIKVAEAEPIMNLQMRGKAAEPARGKRAPVRRGRAPDHHEESDEDVAEEDEEAPQQFAYNPQPIANQQPHFGYQQPAAVEEPEAAPVQPTPDNEALFWDAVAMMHWKNQGEGPSDLNTINTILSTIPDLPSFINTYKYFNARLIEAWKGNIEINQEGAGHIIGKGRDVYVECIHDGVWIDILTTDECVRGPKSFDRLMRRGAPPP